MVGEAAAQVPFSHHQLPVQPGATSPPARASPESALPASAHSFLPPAEIVCHDRHPPLHPLAVQAVDQKHLPCPQPIDLRPHLAAAEAVMMASVRLSEGERDA